MTFVRKIVLIPLTKLISKTSSTLKLGAGGTWPGEIALRFDPDIISNLAKQLSAIVLIAGTNGKTTTAKMVGTILRSEKLEARSKKYRKGIRVVNNATGANLLNGITSALIQTTNLLGNVKANIGIFEVDEAILPLVLKEFTPRVVVLLNLFRDQLDRYGEVDLVAQKWLDCLKKLTDKTTVIVNADDPHLAFIGSKLKAKVLYFGLGDNRYFLGKMPHAVDTIYCPNCGKRLSFKGVYLSHLGEWLCPKCGFKHPKDDIKANEINSPLEGIYNIYNTMAAALIVRELGFNTRISGEPILTSFKPAFGRQEEFTYQGKKIKIFLSKNPAGFNVSLRTVLERKAKALLVALNDHIPDGRDVSWIWDVDFEMIPSNVEVITSGDRVYDMALRVKYASKVKSQKSKVKSYSSKLKIIENLREAIDASLQETEVGETLFILPTYSAMLEVRKILGGRKIL